MKALQNMCWAAVLTATLNTGAATITDTFETTHDYAADGTTNTIWDGFFYNLYGGNTTLAAADANSSNSGVLTLRSTNGNWERGDNDGVLIYKNVNGDFDARVRVISMNNVAWHDAGLIARVADLAAAGAGEDWVAVKHFRHSGLSGHRSTDNNVSVTVELSGLQPWLRLTRQGNALSSYRSLDGTTWERISASTRDDMNGLALQVGIWQATFSNNEGTAQFDDFSLRTPDPWTNSAGGSWPVAGNWSNGVPTGAGSWLLFPGILSNNVSVTLDGNQTAGRIAFATTNNAAYSIVSGNPAGTLTLNDNIGVGGIFSALEIHSGSHSIAVPIALSNKVTVSIAANAELKLREGISGNGGLIKDGSGTLMLTGTHSTYSGNTFVNQGTLICLPLPAGIQAGYMFNNPNNLGEDSSINKNQLTGIGAPAYDANGRFGGALYLNGGSTLVSTLFPTGVPTGSTPYTIALWERSDGSADKGGFIGWGNNTANQCNNLRMDGDNRLNNYWYGNDWNLGGLSTNPKDGNWHHIAVTWDGSTQTMYLDGSQAGSVTRTGLNAQPKNFVIGKTTADVHFKGWLDHVQVANRAFSASEITALMQQSSATENMLPVGTSLHVAAGAMV
ncbi:MAG: autotransporter-associated beta strand repeat-containing protein, partial [Kiritimatiellae bacterium]|nr:autotransporter-associated beta strand repeat-containing protein [Kiritimatiellia bacterium]